MNMVTQDDPRVIAAIEMKRADPSLAVKPLAEQVGLSKSVLYRIFRKLGIPYTTYTCSGALNREAVIAFLDAHTHREKTASRDRVFLFGVVPSETQMRRLHAWRNDPSSQPSEKGLESFLTGPPDLIPDTFYFQFCEREGMEPWKHART